MKGPAEVGLKGREDLRAVLLEEADESIGGGVVGMNVCVILQLRFDLLGQLLAKLHADWTDKNSVNLRMPEISQSTPISHKVLPIEIAKDFDLDSPPLVIAVDIPHHTLHKDLVFIHG